MIKQTFIILILIAALFSLTGCIIYGHGSTVGYVYAVDDGIIWDDVWYKSSPQAGGNGDCYMIDNPQLKEQLRQLSSDTKVKLYYDRHLVSLHTCENGVDDEITGFEVLK